MGSWLIQHKKLEPQGMAFIELLVVGWMREEDYIQWQIKESVSSPAAILQ
jgi:hypothetical protein